MLALVLLCTMSISASGADVPGKQIKANDVIVPYWTNTESIKLDLNFSGKRADCSALVIGKMGTSKITATVKLQRKNSNGTYTTVKTWSNLQTNGTVFSFSQSYNVTRSYTYRLVINATVYKDGSSENVSQQVEKHCS